MIRLGFFSFCSFTSAICLENPVPLDETIEPIRLSYGNWLGALLNCHVAQIILTEMVGIRAVLEESTLYEADYDTTVPFDGDWGDANLEVWGEYDAYKEFLDSGDIAWIGSVGLEGKIGWFAPRFLLEEHPDLDSASSLRYAENVALFQPLSSNSTNLEEEDLLQSLSDIVDSIDGSNLTVETLKTLLIDLVETHNTSVNIEPSLLYSPSSGSGWVQADGELISRLGINFVEFEIDDNIESTLVDILTDAATERKAVLSYFWSPHALFSSQSGVELYGLQFPVSVFDCETLEKVENDPVCSYRTIQLQKLLSPALESKSPVAFEVLKSFAYQSNSQQSEMQGDVVYHNMTEEEAACSFVRSSIDYWETIISQTFEQVPNDLSSNFALALLVLISISTLYVFGVGVLFLVNRNHLVMKQSSIPFCSLYLIGCLFGLASASVFMGINTRVTCALQPWFLSLFFILSYGSLTLRSSQLYAVFHWEKKINPRWESLDWLLLVLFGMTLPALIALTLWSVLDIPIPTSVISTSDLTQAWFCLSQDLVLHKAFSYSLLSHCFLFVTSSTIFGFLNRNLNKNYNESKFIAFAVYNTLIITCLIVLFESIDGSISTAAKYPIITLGLLLVTDINVSLLFIPKLLVVYKHESGGSAVGAETSVDEVLAEFSQSVGKL
eukprot:Lithocolla_globosa_v1_NODE_7_length_11908_cov_272.203830.p3 type:complete len:668 gc:universal NODE_7_length_11908_cov_272.203830:2196-193(-)